MSKALKKRVEMIEAALLAIGMTFNVQARHILLTASHDKKKPKRVKKKGTKP